MKTLALLAASSPLLCSFGGIALFSGPPNGAGDVVLVDPSGATPPVVVPGLAGVTLHPLDANGRTGFDLIRTDRAQFRDDVPGASRLLLPASAGSLYRYSRPGASGRLHGLFVIDGSGGAHRVFELQGVGPGLDQEPFLTLVGVAPQGDEVLVATLPQAGGDLLEISLVSGAITNRTASLPPQAFLPRGLHLSPTWGTAASSSGVWRFDRSSLADATPLTYSGATPSFFSGEIVLSRNGAWGLTTAGVSNQQLHVFAFGPTGTATQVTSNPVWVSAAGFLPDVLHGPFLAISDDGTHCAWWTEGVTREAFLAAVPGGAPGPGQWLTSDTNYTDTIDEIGQFMFKLGTIVLIYSAGEPAGTFPPDIENVDFYEAQLVAGGPSILNLTQTNGIPQPPFLEASELKPQQLVQHPASQSLLFFNERSGGSGDLLAVDPGQVGFTVLVPNVKSVEFIERTGNAVMVDLQRKLGNDPRQLYRFQAPFAPANAPLLTVPGTHHFERTAARADGWFAFVERTPLTKERLWRFDPFAGTLRKLNERQLFFGPATAWAPSGQLAFSVGGGGFLSIFAMWPTATPVQRLPYPVGPGFVLPGV